VSTVAAAPLAPPPEVLVEWWTPFESYLAAERRYSRYTVRNYRQAFDDSAVGPPTGVVGARYAVVDDTRPPRLCDRGPAALRPSHAA
jgi:hypothetical protein